MMFRVMIPGIGNIYVQARDQNEAIAAAQRYANQNGIRLEEGAGNFTATPFAAGSVPGGATVIGADGVPVSGGAARPGGGEGQPGPGDFNPNPPAATAAGGDGSVPFMIDPEEASVFGTYRNFLRDQAGIDPDSVLGGTAQAQFNPLLATFGINQVLHNLQGTIDTAQGAGSVSEQFNKLGTPQSYIDFIKSQGMGGASQTALGALQGIAMNPGGENTFLAALRGATPGSDLGGVVQDATRQALRTRLSPAALGLFGNTAFNLSNRRFEDELAGAASGGTSAPTYVQHLLRTLGLG